MMRIDIQKKLRKSVPAGSKKVRGEKVKAETIDELADLFAGIKPSYNESDHSRLIAWIH